MMIIFNSDFFYEPFFSKSSSLRNPTYGYVVDLSCICRYRLGRPSKQYAPWFGPVIKIARVSLSILNMLKRERRVAKFSYANVIKKKICGLKR